MLGTSFAVDRLGYDPAPWLEDLDALERHMDLVYANLEWVAERRGLNLADLDRRTRHTIRTARSNRAAARALQSFVAAFRDPHFGIEHRLPAGIGWAFRLFGDAGEEEEPHALPAGASGREVCEALGYRDRDHDFTFPVQRLAGWAPLGDDGAFPSGTLTLPDGRRAGLLRIEHFSENGYRAACVETWEAESMARTRPCEPACLDAFRRRASDALARRVVGRVDALRAARVAAIVVDVTGNGGGSEWVDPVTRIFSATPLRSMRATTVRHPRSLAAAEARLAAIERVLAGRDLPVGTRERLEDARARLERVVAEIATPCDRSPLWEGRPLECSQLLTPLYTTGVFDGLPPDALVGVDDSLAAELYSPFGRDVPAGVWNGPLYVLADRRSASATEAFIAMLKDNGAATIIGERTYGAGCGFLDGGLPLELPNSGLEVWMPDCVRLRIDGTNEIEGIEPDVAIPWSDLDGEERARELTDVLSGIPRS